MIQSSVTSTSDVPFFLWPHDSVTMKSLELEIKKPPCKSCVGLRSRSGVLISPPTPAELWRIISPNYTQRKLWIWPSVPLVSLMTPFGEESSVPTRMFRVLSQVQRKHQPDTCDFVFFFKAGFVFSMWCCQAAEACDSSAERKET